MKVIFKTQFSPRERIHCPHGQKVETRHTAHIDSNGRRFLAADKKVATFDLIQSHKEECEIENIIRRAVEGDYNALNAVNGVYADITGMPSSIAEAQQYIINAKEEFDKLPKNIKAKFEYNPEIYIAELGGDTKTWLDKMGFTEEAEKMKFQAEQRAKVDENFAKAMQTIAEGKIINNPKGEVETNE